jgi:catechol 2,3-dioxygenase-like lactoylglutathione lyase family enzyme
VPVKYGVAFTMINAIQHVGIGVRDRDRSFDFYNNALRFSVLMSYSTDNCSGMTAVIGNDETRNVVIALNPRGGALVELFQYISKTPAPIPEAVDFTYNGFLYYGLKVKNVKRSLDIIKKHGGSTLTAPMDFSPLKNRGWKTAVFRDPDGVYGILIEYPESNVGYGNGTPRIGGIDYTAIGVSNLKDSIDFYSKILGYDDIIYTNEGSYSEWDVLFGKGRKIKRALIRKSEKAQGLFKHFLRGGMIELIEAEGNNQKHNFDGRNWGDIGFMELCFDVTDIDATVAEIEKKGVSLAVPIHGQDMGLGTCAKFAYIRDPDGSLLEFADIKKLPVPYFFIRTLVNPFIIGIAKRIKLLK